MKRCGACGEEFENQFSFCPTDGKSLVANRDTATFDYRPTIISDESLAQRLAIQFAFLLQRFRATWPRFKADPFGFLQNQFRQFKNNATPIPPQSAAMGRLGFLASRTNAWLSLPMLFFMGAASHYPFLGR